MTRRRPWLFGRRNVRTTGTTTQHQKKKRRHRGHTFVNCGTNLAFASPAPWSSLAASPVFVTSASELCLVSLESLICTTQGMVLGTEFKSIKSEQLLHYRNIPKLSMKVRTRGQARQKCGWQALPSKLRDFNVILTYTTSEGTCTKFLDASTTTLLLVCKRTNQGTNVCRAPCMTE